MKRRGWALAAVLALPTLVLLALVLRCASLRSVLASAEQRAAGAPRLLLCDERTCLELRAVEVALAQNELLLVDRALFHPLGDIARDAPGLPGALALALQLAGWRLGAVGATDASAPEWLAVALPPLFGALCVVAVWAVARMLLPARDALFAALLAALWTPGSLAGELHSGTPAALLALVSIASFTWGIRSGSDFDRVLGSVFSGGVAGLALFASLSTWPLLCAAHGWLAIRAARSRGVGARDLHRAAVLHSLGCALVLLIPARASLWNLLAPGTLQALSTAWLALPLGLGAGHGIALFLFRRGIEERPFVRGLLPLGGAVALLALDGALAPLQHGVLAPGPQVWIAASPLLAMRVGAARWRTCIAILVLAGSALQTVRFVGSTDASLLSALRALREADGDRGAWPAAGAAHPAGVYAPERAALVPFHARRAVLPGAFAPSSLDTPMHRELRLRIDDAGRGDPVVERDQRLAAFGASHALERDALGTWRVRRLPVLPQGSPQWSAPPE